MLWYNEVSTKVSQYKLARPPAGTAGCSTIFGVGSPTANNCMHKLHMYDVSVWFETTGILYVGMHLWGTGLHGRPKRLS